VNRKKELKEKYKNTRPDMGVFKIASRVSGSCYLYSAQNMNGLMNRYRFQLGVGSHPNRALQDEWNEQGEGSFEFAVLERLEYDRDESKTDYSEELEMLHLIWTEKLN
jgi:hypothetical protein